MRAPMQMHHVHKRGALAPRVAAVRAPAPAQAPLRPHPGPRAGREHREHGLGALGAVAAAAGLLELPRAASALHPHERRAALGLEVVRSPADEHAADEDAVEHIENEERDHGLRGVVHDHVAHRHHHQGHELHFDQLLHPHPEAEVHDDGLIHKAEEHVERVLRGVARARDDPRSPRHRSDGGAHTVPEQKQGLPVGDIPAPLEEPAHEQREGVTDEARRDDARDCAAERQQVAHKEDGARDGLQDEPVPVRAPPEGGVAVKPCLVGHLLGRQEEAPHGPAGLLLL
mmetsp:Transcript_39944/g.127741  ORF Transcript_39944/g.127741 Transcript_39944/m.127741 type:complete len:286 (+) Transcript_39944:1880-2737(+)